MKKKLSMVILALACALVFIVTYIVFSANKTTKAVVLNTAVEPGVTITEDMVTELDIPAKTPEGYLKQTQSVIGFKSKTRIEKDQLLYDSNFMSSWTNYADSDKIPDDYTITAISVPDLQACGGVITAGDYVDVMAVFPYSTDTSTWTSSSDEGTAQEIYGTGRSDTGTTVAFILSNVYILNTNSSLAEAQDSDMSVSNDDGDTGSSDPFYICALSYDDLKKLRQVEGVEGVKLYLNISPSQNQVEGNSPLIKQMMGQSYSYLHDAQVAVQDKDGKMLTDNYYVPSEDGGAVQTPAQATPNEDSSNDNSGSAFPSSDESSTEESSED